MGRIGALFIGKDSLVRAMKYAALEERSAGFTLNADDLRDKQRWASRDYLAPKGHY